MQNLFHIRTRASYEIQRRIRLSVWAYGYEVESDTMVPDHIFDREACLVDLSIDTGRPDLDNWFRANFSPDTGMWIRNHPELGKIKGLYKHGYHRHAIT